MENWQRTKKVDRSNIMENWKRMCHYSNYNFTQTKLDLFRFKQLEISCNLVKINEGEKREQRSSLWRNGKECGATVLNKMPETTDSLDFEG